MRLRPSKARHGAKAPTVAAVMAYQKVTLDLRNWKLLRGEESPSGNTGPIQLPRGRLDLTFFLPPGSGPGNYEVQLSTESEKPVVSAAGAAVIENGITVLEVKLDVSKLNPGSYVLGIGEAGTEPTYYPCMVK